MSDGPCTVYGENTETIRSLARPAQFPELWTRLMYRVNGAPAYLTWNTDFYIIINYEHMTNRSYYYAKKTQTKPETRNKKDRSEIPDRNTPRYNNRIDIIKKTVVSTI